MLGLCTLLVALAAQIGYTLYCVKKKTPRPALKYGMRVAGFAVFSLGLLVGAYQWGFRWFLLFAVLAGMAVSGAVYFIRKPGREKPFSTARAVVACALGMLLLSAAALPGVIFPPYKPIAPIGGYEVAHSPYHTYTDTSRAETFAPPGQNRTVTAEFWYPADADGVYPLVLFTHGLYGAAISNTSTYETLAGSGYVVCSVSHPYVSMYTRDEEGNITTAHPDYLRDAAVLNSGIDDQAAIYDAFEKLLAIRIADVNFVLDTILANADGGVYELIDTDRIGVAGHSMGGATVSAVSGARGDIDAIVNLDAPLFGGYPTAPLLNIYSDDLWGLMDTDPLYATNVRLLSDTPGDVYNTHFDGAKHLSFTDLPFFSPALANNLQGGKAAIDKYYCVETMNGLIVAFFDRYLKDGGVFAPRAAY